MDKAIFFTARWCHGCKSMKPFLPEHVQIVDVDDDPDLAKQYEVHALPTLVAGDRRVSGAGKDMLDLIRSL